MHYPGGDDEALNHEAANVHPGAKAAVGLVLKELNQRPAKRLRRAAETAVKATLEDWKSRA